MANQFVFLLRQHVGAPCEPVVKVGDEVKVGTLLAKPTGLGANIHSSCDGKVASVDSNCIKVDVTNAGKPDGSFVKVTASTPLDLIKEAGYSKENPLKIDIYLCSNDDMKKVGTTLQDIFTRAFEGLVICTLSFDDWSTYLSNLTKGNFDIVWSCWIADYNTPSNLSMLYYGGNDNNYGFYKDEEFDYNYKQSLISNKEDYITYQKKCNKIATQSFCAIPFSIDKRIRLVTSNIKGFQGNVLDRIKTKSLSK